MRQKCIRWVFLFLFLFHGVYRRACRWTHAKVRLRTSIELLACIEETDIRYHDIVIEFHFVHRIHGESNVVSVSSVLNLPSYGFICIFERFSMVRNKTSEQLRHCLCPEQIALRCVVMNHERSQRSIVIETPCARAHTYISYGFIRRRKLRTSNISGQK